MCTNNIEEICGYEIMQQKTKDDGEQNIYAYGGEACVLLEDDDVQCGRVFFNVITRIVKYFCTFCSNTFDNINYFCEHLSEHINESKNDFEMYPNNVNKIFNEMADEDDMCVENISCSESFAYSTQNSEEGDDEVALHTNHDYSSAVLELTNSDIIVEELHEDVMHQEMEGEIDYEDFNKENSYCSEFFSYTDKENKDETRISSDNMHRETRPHHCTNSQFNFQQCFVDSAISEKVFNDLPSTKNETETNTYAQMPIETETRLEQVTTSNTFEHQPTKKKRVVTVKVIAVRNRIAELYEQIQLEEEKRSKAKMLLDDETGKVGENCEILEKASKSNPCCITDCNDKPKEEAEKQVLVRKVGETLITLIPDEAIKPALTMRSPLFTPTSTTSINMLKSDQLKFSEQSKTCPACGRQFRSAFSLTIHKRSHYLESNSSIKLAHKCSDCDALFNTITDYKEHLQKSHYPDGFICKICNKKLSSLSLLESHMRKVHLNRPFNCKACNKNFNNHEHYQTHVNTHVEGQRFRCNICGRKYCTEPILKQHINRHKEQVPQCCVVCGKMTLRITQHMKIHTPRPRRLLCCSVCGKKFNFSSNLSHHFKVKHNMLRRRTKPKPSEDVVGKEVASRKAKHKQQYDQNIVSEIEQKEQEAKKVIVELVQNSAYATLLTDDYTNSNIMEIAPPIAREEIISAVNSIVTDN